MEYFRKASHQPDINATPGRVARVAGTTMTSFKAKTKSLMKTFIGGEEVEKQVRLILICSLIAFIILYLIVVISRKLLGILIV